MAETVNAKACCNVVVKSIDDYFATTPSDKIEMPGVLAGLISPDNMRNLKVVPTRGGENNEIIDFRGRFVQNGRQTASDGYPNKCDTSGDMTGQKSTTFDLMTAKTTKVVLSESEMQEICHSMEDNGNRISNVSGFKHAQSLFTHAIHQLLVAIDAQLANKLVASTGNFKDGTSVKKTLKLLRTVDLQDYTPNLDGLIELKKQFRNLEVNPNEILAFGDGILADWFEANKYSCCSSAGTDLSKLNAPFRFFRSAQIDENMAGEDNIIAIKPGMAVPFFASEFDVLAYQMEMPDFSKKTVKLPFTFGGTTFIIPVDMQVYYNKCNTDGSPVASAHSKWVVNFTARTGLATLPSDIEPSGSPFEGVNYILPFQGTKVTS